MKDSTRSNTRPSSAATEKGYAPQATELPPWRSPLARALHRNRSLPHLKFVQLATVDAQGYPRNRTVVYRGLVEQTHQLKFITDRRSDKMLSLQNQAQVEVCWYFTKTREQFRFAGQMLAIDGESAEDAGLRQEAWQRLSDNAQRQFYWPTPGERRAPDAAFEEIEPLSLPPDSFVLLLLSPMQVEHLQLRGNPQERKRYGLRNEGWGVERINP
ncbi:MAG: Npun_F5749 family FMN-dependent PPOX-type flavoprotein [Cyanobacteria bacterium P01_F01_bin.42]